MASGNQLRSYTMKANKNNMLTAPSKLCCHNYITVLRVDAAVDVIMTSPPSASSLLPTSSVRPPVNYCANEAISDVTMPALVCRCRTKAVGERQVYLARCGDSLLTGWEG